MHVNRGRRVMPVETRDTGRTRRATLWGAVATVMLLTFGGFAAPIASADTAPAAGTPETFAADALPTVQIDGVVYAQEVVGNTVYVGGSFAKARPAGSPAGSNETPRANLLAYDLTTGNLISSWNPGANGTVLDIKKSADGTRIYVAGMFSQVSGAWRYRVAAFDTATGALITTWAPAANGKVEALAVTDSAVFLAGEFTTINGAQRTKVAAVSTSAGTVTPFTASVMGGYGAKAVVVSPDRSKIVVAGSFTSVNGSTSPGSGITALNANTGAIMPWAMNSVLSNSGPDSSMYSLASDGDSVYGTGQGSAATWEGAFRASWSDGSLIWMEDCHGDSYDVAPVGDSIYVVGHAHHCGNIGGFPESQVHKNSLAFSKAPSGQLITQDSLGYRSFTGKQAPSPLQWYPDWEPGTYTGTSQGPWQVSSSGDYLLVGGEFLKVNGAAQQGIVRFAKKNVAPNKQGPQVQGGAWKLTVASLQKGANRLTWAANSDRDNQSLRYQVFRQDKGMTTPLYETTQLSTFWAKPSMSYVDSTAVPGTTYNYRVKATDAFGNSTQSDWTPVTTTSALPSAYDSAVLAGGAARYWPLSEATGSLGYDWAGTSDLLVAGATRGTAGPTATGATSATTFGGTSASTAGTMTAVRAPQTVSVEAWFKTNSTRGGEIVGFGNSAAGSSSSTDRNVYLDGAGRVSFGVYPGAVKTISSGTGFNDNTWHHVVGAVSPAGQVLYVDGVKIGESPSVTSAYDYTGYWRVGGDNNLAWPNSGTSGFLGGSISNVAIYERALSAAQVSEHYRLGTTATPNTAPAAAFTPTVTGLSLAVDGSPSTDPDGTIQAYAWTFGDGGTATGVAASHSYATAGTYDVTLTVTDSAGTPASVTKQVSVTAPPAAQMVAADAFTRTVPIGGWGSADFGGAWTLAGGANAFSVAGGKGSVALTPSSTRSARLGLSTTNATIRVSIAADQVATGGAATATVVARQVGATSYSARIRFEVGGGVRLYLLRDEVALGSYLMPGVTYTPGTALNVALSATGTSPTTLTAKVWRASDAEPATWQVAATDTTPALQAAGTVGIMNTVSSASTIAATTFTWDDLTIVTP